MSDLQIENQGRHDGDGFGELASDLWSNKPLLIVFGALLFVAIYLIAKNRQGTLTAPTPATNSQSGAASGNYLIVNDITPPDVNVTVNGSTGGTGGTPPPGNPPPKGIFCAKGMHWDGTKCVPNILPPGPPPIPLPPPPQPPPPPPPPPAARTVTVTPWPTQDSTLWGIAQHYGYGSNWQVIYNANRATIGDNPNFLRIGEVLRLP